MLSRTVRTAKTAMNSTPPKPSPGSPMAQPYHPKEGADSYLACEQGVFAEKGARFRGKWGLGAPPPPPPPPTPRPRPGAVGVLLKIPGGGSSRRGGGGEGGGRARGVYGEFGGGGGQGAPRPHLPRKRAPFSAKTP